MEDVEFISELFIALLAGPQDKKRSLENYYEDFETRVGLGSFAKRERLSARFSLMRRSERGAERVTFILCFMLLVVLLIADGRLSNGETLLTI